MVYTAKVKFYDSFDDAIKTHRLFVDGANYKEILQKITDYYSNDAIESLTMEQFSPESFLIFDQDNKELFKNVESTLGKKVFW